MESPVSRVTIARHPAYSAAGPTCTSASTSEPSTSRDRHCSAHSARTLAVSRSLLRCCVCDVVLTCGLRVQSSDLDCQWIDITGLEAGEYVLRVEINQYRQIAESSFDNNVAVIKIAIP